MPLILKDEQQRLWIAVEHSDPAVRADGPAGLANDRSAFVQFMRFDPEKKAFVPLGEGKTQCYLGAQHNATRVNFKWKARNTWWHITQGDQIEDTHGHRVNFYREIEDMSPRVTPKPR